MGQAARNKRDDDDDNDDDDIIVIIIKLISGADHNKCKSYIIKN